MPNKKKQQHKAEAAAPRKPEPRGEAALADALSGLGAPGLGGNGGGTGAAHAQSAAPAAGSAQPQAHPPEIGPKTVAAVLGEIVWLMTQSPRHKTLPIADLEWMLMPPVLLKQFRIYYSGERPVGVVLWALVDDAVERRLHAGEKRLAPAEWKCGTHRRIVEIIAPFGGEEEMRKGTE